MDRRIVIALLCLVVVIVLPVINNTVQYGGADPVQLPPPSAPVQLTPPSAPVQVPPPSAPVTQVFKFLNYTITMPNAIDPFIRINSDKTVRVINPYSYTFTDDSKKPINIASLRGKPYNVLDALTYLVMFPQETKVINAINTSTPNPELKRIVQELVATGLKYRRHFKIIKPTVLDSVVLANSSVQQDAPLRLYSSRRNEKESPIGNWIDVSEYDNNGNSRAAMLELKKREIKNKESKFMYDCTTVAGASEFLTDLAYYPALTGCHYESYGNRNI